MHTITKLTFAGLALAAASPSPALAQGGPGDFRDQILYHFMPMSWRDSDNDGVNSSRGRQRFGDFNGMTDSIGYLTDLGVTGVWLNPIFPSPAYHGYQHGPADQVNPRFGTEAEFLNFVSQASAAGMDTYLDFVVYGISHDSTWFQDARGNPGSIYDDYLAFENGSNTSYLGSTFPTWNGDTVGFVHLDLRTQAVRDIINTWGQYWLDPNQDGDPSDGIAGYRLDHVWEFYCCGPDGWGYNLDSFWLEWRAALEAVNPEVVTFAEQADWGILGDNLLPAFDATFTKPFEFAARDALRNETAGPLNNAILFAQNSLENQPGKTYVATIGNHDVDRLASSIGADTPQTAGRSRAAAAVLLTQPFPPNIYYGDELGMRGTKANYGSDANDIPMREPMPWNAAGGQPESNYWALNTQAYFNRFDQPNDGISVAEQQGVTGSLFELYKELIAVRTASPALRRGTYLPVNNDQSQVWTFVREYESEGDANNPEQTVLVAINMSGQARTATLNLGAASIPAPATPAVLFGSSGPGQLSDATKSAYPITLGAYEAVVLEVNFAFDPNGGAGDGIDGLDVPDLFMPSDLVATQENPTGFGDNQSELNQMFVRATDRVPGGGLHIGITGNLELNGNGLCLLFDTDLGGSSGQSVIDLTGYNPPPGEPLSLTGMEFDSGFRPDTMVYFNAPGGTMYVDRFDLFPGGTNKVYLGSTTAGIGDGSLTSGQVSSSTRITLENTNSAGVTSSSADGAATATDGFEILIPFSEIGMTAERCSEVGVLALVIGAASGDISNQFLPPLPPGTPNPITGPDLTALAGDQFAVARVAAVGDVTTTNTNPGSPLYGVPDLVVDGADLSFYVERWLAADAGVAFDVTTTNTNPGDSGYGLPDGSTDGADLSFFVEKWLGACN